MNYTNSGLIRDHQDTQNLLSFHYSYNIFTAYNHHSLRVKPTPLPFSPFSSTTHQILISQNTPIKTTPIQSPPHSQSTLLTRTTLHPHHHNKPITFNPLTKQKDSTITTHQLQPNTPLPSHHFIPLHQHTSLPHQLTIAYAPTAFSRNR